MMKSLAEVAQNIQVQESPKNAVGLASRPTPLTVDEIVKIQNAVDKYFTVKNEESYGYVPVMENGTAIRQEFDVVGEVTNYKPKTNAPAALWETLLRPAPKSHVIYHLGRLAAHRRNTRGGEAFQVIMEDIALDVGDVSEWAVVMACAEMRKKNSAWFPNTGEILDIIKKYSSMLENLYVKRLEGAKPAEGKSFNRRDMNNYYKNPKENPLRRELCDFLLQKGEPDYFDFTAMYSNYQLEIVAASKYGWRSATINGGSVASDPDQAPMLD